MEMAGSIIKYLAWKTFSHKRDLSLWHSVKPLLVLNHEDAESMILSALIPLQHQSFLLNDTHAT